MTRKTPEELYDELDCGRLENETNIIVSGDLKINQRLVLHNADLEIMGDLIVADFDLERKSELIVRGQVRVIGNNVPKIKNSTCHVDRGIIMTKPKSALEVENSAEVTANKIHSNGRLDIDKYSEVTTEIVRCDGKLDISNRSKLICGRLNARNRLVDDNCELKVSTESTTDDSSEQNQSTSEKVKVGQTSNSNGTESDTYTSDNSTDSSVEDNDFI